MKGILRASICRCCKNQSETSNHLFIDGPVASEVWYFFANIFGIKLYSDSLNQMLLSWWIRPSKVDYIQYLLLLLPGIILWEIWISRNQNVFEGITMDSKKIIPNVFKFMHMCSSNKYFQSKSMAYENVKDLFSIKFVPKPNACFLVKWLKPIDFQFKLNTDGTSKNNPGVAGSGGIIKDQCGRFVSAFSSFEGIMSNTRAECVAILNGLKICKDLNLSILQVESNSQFIINILKGIIPMPPWSLLDILKEIKDLDMDISCSHYWREANKVADCLANHGIENKQFKIFSSAKELPKSAIGCYRMELQGIPSIRLLK